MPALKPVGVEPKNWRRGSELNRRIKVLQTFALPLGYRARRESLLAKYRAGECQVKPARAPLPPRRGIRPIRFAALRPLRTTRAGSLRRHSPGTVSLRPWAARSAPSRA